MCVYWPSILPHHAHICRVWSCNLTYLDASVKQKLRRDIVTFSPLPAIAEALENSDSLHTSHNMLIDIRSHLAVVLQYRPPCFRPLEISNWGFMALLLPLLLLWWKGENEKG